MSRTNTARTSTRRALSSGVLAFVALALPMLSLPMLAHAACQVQSIELPVKMAGSRAVATVSINGTPVPLTVDSGAFYSIITDAAAAQLGLRTRPLSNPNLRLQGVTGQIPARTTTVEKLQLLKGEISNIEFIVGGNEPGAGTMGLMGRNILAFTDTEYDLAHGVIRFLFPNDDCGDSNMAYWAGSTPVTEVELLPDRRSKTPSIRARVKLNGSELVALLDTGATTIVTTRTASRAGVAESALKPSGTIYGAGAGTTRSWTADFDKFEIGGEVIRGNRLRVADIDVATDDANMLLGIDFFLSHRIYVSKKQSKMFFTYNGGPVFSLDKVAAPGNANPEGNPIASGAEGASAEELARRGAASAARRDYASALADLDRACELEPTSAAFLAQRGSIQLALKQPAKAMEDFDKALTLSPTEVDARFRRAQLRFFEKDPDGARADLDVLDKALAPQAQMRLPMSAIYQAMGQYAQTIAQVNQWLPAHPNEVQRDVALNERCWARVMLGIELDQALSDCDDAIDGDSKNAAYRDSRGWVYLRQGRYGKAIADFDRSIADQPRSGSSLYGRGLAKIRLGDAAAGNADVAAAHEVQPNVELRTPRIAPAPESPPKP